jgi:hypothetical protein
MIDVGNLREFARNLGKWLYGVNPNLDAEKLKTVIQQFATSAPIGVGDSSALSFDEFCREAASSYAEEASD